jgi:hypothetical protein
LVALGCSITLCSLLGPLALGLIVYRTSVAAERQIVGADAAGLFVSAPVSIAVGVLLLRGRREVAVLGMAPAVFAAYTYTQLAVGNEFLHRPGKRREVLPVAGGGPRARRGGGRRSLDRVVPPALPVTSRRQNHVAGATLLGVAAFVAIGLHLPTYLDAVSALPVNFGYLGSPAAFWLVKLMDLELVTPVAVAVGMGLLRDRTWARRPRLAIIGSLYRGVLVRPGRRTGPATR